MTIESLPPPIVPAEVDLADHRLAVPLAFIGAAFLAAFGTR